MDVWIQMHYLLWPQLTLPKRCKFFRLAAMEQFSKKNKSDEVSTAHQSKQPDEKISDEDDSSEEKSSENQTKKGKEETETINKPKGKKF